VSARGSGIAAVAAVAATTAVVIRPIAINFPSAGGCKIFEETLRQVKTIRSTAHALVHNLGLRGLPIARYGNHGKAVRARVATTIFGSVEGDNEVRRLIYNPTSPKSDGVVCEGSVAVRLSGDQNVAFGTASDFVVVVTRSISMLGVGGERENGQRREEIGETHFGRVVEDGLFCGGCRVQQQTKGS